MNEFEIAKAKGLHSPYGKGFMPFTRDASGKITVHFDKLAQDAAMTTAPNVGVPMAFVQYIDPQVVPILFAVQNATKMFAETRQGTWIDKSYTFAVEEYVGNVTPYSDFTENVSSDVNVEWPERQNFLFQTVIKYGDQEQDLAAAAKYALVAAKQRSAAFVLATAHNRFYMYGVAGKRIYGILNDPNLPTSETPISVNSKSTWADKTAADPEKVANLVYNDINKLWTSLTSKNGGHLDANTKLILGISNKMVSYLTTPNSFGLTAMAMLKANFPNLEIVQMPELSTASGEMLYMTVPELLGVQTGFTAYSEKMRFGRVVPKLSSFEQKCVGGTWGAIIKRPQLVATMLGI